MAETSGFFEARLNEETEEYDRLYYAEQFANYFKLFIGNGIFIQDSNQLQVESVAGMNIKVNPGWGFINGYWYNNSEELNITIPVNTFTADRYDLVVLRKDLALREISIVYLENETNIRRDGNYYDLALAKIKVPVGSASISNSNITDKRPDEEVCGFVKGLVDIITTDALFNQFTAQFNEWFTDIKEKLEEDPAGKLQAQIGNLGELVTVNKDNLVKSINEVVDKLDNLSAEDVRAVAGVKGNNETTYRTGQVNLTPVNLGAVAVGDRIQGYDISNYVVDNLFSDMGFTIDNTFDDLYQLLRSNKDKFENYFQIETNSNISIFSNSLPIQSGCIIECIGIKHNADRCIFKIHNFRNNDVYINTALDGVLNGWRKISTLKDNEHNLKTYTGFSQIGITDGQETIDSIVTALPDRSEFFSYIGGNHATIYPYQYGTLTVKKFDKGRVELKFQTKGSDETWIGGWADNYWSGWKKVLTDNGIEFQIVDGELQYRYDTEVWGVIKWHGQTGKP